MGYTYEVEEWIVDGVKTKYRLAYAGNSLIKALITILKLKLRGVGCIKFEWRGGI